DGDRAPGRKGRIVVDVPLQVVVVVQGLQDEPGDVLSGRHAADGAGEDVVEHQGRHGQFGQKAAHRFLDHAIDAAADEEGAALDVDRADGVAEEHDGQDEPGGGGSDGRLDDAADVVGGAGEVAQHHGGRAPVRDEREHHARHDQHLRRPGEALHQVTTG